MRAMRHLGTVDQVVTRCERITETFILKVFCGIFSSTKTLWKLRFIQF